MPNSEELEKQRRVLYQDLVYCAMNTLDKILGRSIRNGVGWSTTETFRADCHLLQEHVRQLKDDITRLKHERDEARTFARVFYPHARQNGMGTWSKQQWPWLYDEKGSEQ